MTSVENLIVLAPTFAIAYLVFALVGSGTTLISAPIAAHIVPLPILVPAQALLDLIASAGNGLKLIRQVNREELIRLLVPMILGLAVGTYLLLKIDVQVLMIVLGVFVVLYAIRGLLAHGQKPLLSSRRAYWFGFSGGVLSALFGAGAWLYAIYLTRRLESPQEIRATQTALIAGGCVIRVVFFTIVGKYSDWTVIGLSISLLPAMALGIYAGNRLAHRLNRTLFMRVLLFLLLVTGSSLIVRGVANIL